MRSSINERDDRRPEKEEAIFKEKDYSWKDKESHITDLPRYLRGRIKRSENFKEKKHLFYKIKEWMSESSVISAFTGSNDWIDEFPEVKNENPSYFSIGNDDGFTYFYLQQYSNIEHSSLGNISIPVHNSYIIFQYAHRDGQMSSHSSYIPIEKISESNDFISHKEATNSAKSIISELSKYEKTPRKNCKKNGKYWKYTIYDNRKSKLKIIPFHGSFFIAYEIIAKNHRTGETISIFIDSSTGKAIGLPTFLNRFSDTSYYKNSVDALSKNHSFIDLSTKEIPISPFQLSFDQGESWIDNNASEEKKREKFLEKNIIYHSKKTYDYFSKLEIKYRNNETGNLEHNLKDVSVIKDYIDITLGRYSDPAVFVTPNENQNKATVKFTNLKTIKSRKANNVECDENNKHIECYYVYNPTEDPEIIYHEITHALMWMIYPLPFRAHPLGSKDSYANGAILEGFANYFAASIGADTDDISKEHIWARASFTENHGGSLSNNENWGRRWVFNYSGSSSLLSQYFKIDLDKDPYLTYDVGMILGEVLWEIRSIIGRSYADKLALVSYGCTFGWMSNFEALAEGFIDAAKSCGITDNGVFSFLFKRKGIQSDDIVESFLIKDRSAYLSNNKGLLIGNISNRNTLEWENDYLNIPHIPNVSSKDNQIIVSCIDDETYYCSTKKKIYKYSNNQLIPIVDIPNKISGKPFAIHVKNKDILLCGFKEGNTPEENKPIAFHCKLNSTSSVTQNPTWIENKKSYIIDMHSEDKLVYAIGENLIHIFDISKKTWIFKRKILDPKNTKLIDPSNNEPIKAVNSLCFHVDNINIYIGTEKNGLFLISKVNLLWALENDGNFNIENIIPYDDIKNPINFISENHSGIYISTNSELYKLNKHQSNYLIEKDSTLDKFPKGRLITSLSNHDSSIFVGTSFFGIYQSITGGWANHSLNTSFPFLKISNPIFMKIKDDDNITLFLFKSSETEDKIKVTSNSNSNWTHRIFRVEEFNGVSVYILSVYSSISPFHSFTLKLSI